MEPDKSRETSLWREVEREEGWFWLGRLAGGAVSSRGQ